MICNACVYSIARIEYNDFDSLHSVAAIPFLAVDIDNDNPACMHALSIHHISLPPCIPYHSSPLLIKHAQKEPDSSTQTITHVSYPSIHPSIHANQTSSPSYHLRPLQPNHPPPPPLPIIHQNQNKIPTNLPLPPRLHHINESPCIGNSLLRTALWCFLLFLWLNLSFPTKER